MNSEYQPYPTLPATPSISRTPRREHGSVGPIRTQPITCGARPAPYARNSHVVPNLPDLQSGMGQAQPSPPTSDNTASMKSTQSSLASDQTVDQLKQQTYLRLRDNVRALQANQDNPDIVFEIAQSLSDIPEGERWQATLVLLLSGIQQSHANAKALPPNNQTESPVASPLATTSQSVAHPPNSTNIPHSLKGFVRAHIRPILLRSSLDCYGRRAGRKNHAANTPFSIMKDLLEKQDVSFLTQLPANYRDDAKWTAQFDNLITEQLKADKFKLATLIQTNLPATGSPLRPVTKLKELVADTYSGMLTRYKDVPSSRINKEVSKADKARLAYLRLMINLNRHQRIENGEAKTPTFWHQIDDDLNMRTGKSRSYRIAFAQLILKKDRALWNGINTINDVSPDDFALPTEEEIQGEEERNKGKAEEVEEEEEEDASTES